MGNVKQLDSDQQANASCSICGKWPATGYWHGTQGYLYVCSHCALNVLPALIADAIIDNGKMADPSVKKRDLEHFEKVFWRALYFMRIRLDRGLKTVTF